MKALVKKEKKTGLWIDDIPTPEIGPHDILIKINKTAICGTDLHIYNWDEWSQKTIPVPMAVGHEYVGTVAKIGKEVSHLKLETVFPVKGTSFADIAEIVALAAGISVHTPREWE